MKRTMMALCLLLTPAAAVAQSYPARPVTIVVSAAAGGISDVVARALGQRLSENWGQQVIIENRGGGAHAAGASSVARAAPDGHTLLIAEAGTFVINPTLYPESRLSYDVEKDLAPITALVRVNQALVARSGLPANGVSELIALAKTKPGQVTFATSGVGSAPHVNLAMFQSLAHVEMQAVHYRGAAPALNDVMAGHVDLMSISVSSIVQPAAEKKLKILGVGSASRIAQLPDVPTASESGLPGYEAGAWIGLVTTAGTPRVVIDRINADVRRILADQAFRERFLAPQLFEPMTSSADDFTAFIALETRKWANVIREQKLAVSP